MIILKIKHFIFLLINKMSFMDIVLLQLYYKTLFPLLPVESAATIAA